MEPTFVSRSRVASSSLVAVIVAFTCLLLIQPGEGAHGRPNVRAFGGQDDSDYSEETTGKRVSIGSAETYGAKMMDEGLTLDEGDKDIDGGGFSGCGSAPLNSVTANKHGRYIIKGEAQKEGEFPQYVHVNVNGGAKICGGTLVSDNQVLTAARCVFIQEEKSWIETSSINITLAEHKREHKDAAEQTLGVSSICGSSKYEPKVVRFDWALLTLDRPVKFSDYIQPACLPRPNQLIKTRGPESHCMAVGLGLVDADTDPLEITNVPTDTVQKIKMENIGCDTGFGPIDEDRTCYYANTKDLGAFCDGDFGGPMLCLDEQKRWTLMGMISNGPKDCSVRRRGNVFTRVRTLLSSIQEECGVNLLH